MAVAWGAINVGRSNGVNDVKSGTAVTDFVWLLDKEDIEVEELAENSKSAPFAFMASRSPESSLLNMEVSSESLR